MKITEKSISDLMKALDITREEAIETLKFDNEEIELDEVNEMTEKAKDIVKGEKRGRKPNEKGQGVTGVTQLKREKKINENKIKIIQILSNGLTNAGISPNVTNEQKTILIELNGKKYEIDLKEKREPKEK